MKKLLCILIAVLLLCLPLASCDVIEEVDTPTPENTTTVGNLTYVSLRINPEVEMVVDETEKVVSANAVNADGEVVLSETPLEGKTVEEAAEAFTETAIDLGYMTEGKDTVYVDVNGDNAEKVEKVEKSLSDKLTKFFEKKGITAKVSKEVLDSYIAAAEEHEITPGHAKIIARVLEANPELTYDKLLSLTVKELLELLKTNDHKVDITVKDSYKEAIKSLKDEYAELFHLYEVIDDLEDDLDEDEDELSEEKKAQLEKELAEAKAKMITLEKEYKEKLDSIKAKFKEESKTAQEEHKKEAEERRKCKQEGKPFDKPDDDDDDDDDKGDKKPEPSKNEPNKKDDHHTKPSDNEDEDD